VRCVALRLSDVRARHTAPLDVSALHFQQPNPSTQSMPIHASPQCSVELRLKEAEAVLDLAATSYRGEILPLPFLRYRFCELKYRGAVGLGYRSTYKPTLFV
jgi:hypothetical protein